MADTVAVMNQGRIEQMGAPADIYENPRTAFVANFLGQSNLFPGSVVGREGDTTVVSAHGVTFRIPTARVATTGDSVVVGVRPEKVVVRAADRAGEPDASRNSLPGVVTDASFTGLSTQYLVRTAWGQELQVFSQNLSADDVVRLGEDVVVSWDPSHSFGLDGSEDLNAGVDKELLALGHIAGSDGAAAPVGG